jgi:hypothetical protein
LGPTLLRRQVISAVHQHSKYIVHAPIASPAVGAYFVAIWLLKKIFDLAYKDLDLFQKTPDLFSIKTGLIKSG